MQTGPARPANELQLLTQAVGLHQQGRLMEAEAIYLRILQSFPRNHNALGFLGTIYLQQGDAMRALGCLDRSLALQMKQPLVLSNRGAALLQLRRADDALQSFERALRYQSIFPDALWGKIMALQQLGRAKDAIAQLRSFIAQNPAHAEAHNQLGMLLYAQSAYDEAAESYGKAIGLQATHAQAHHNLGLVHARRKRFDEAEQSFARALSLKEDLLDAYIERAQALLRVYRLDEALACMDALIRIAPEWADAHSNRAAVLQGMNRIEEALVSIDHALALMPDSPDFLWNKACLLLTQGDYANGWPMYEARWRRSTKTRLLDRLGDKPKWSGREDIRLKRILLHPEQGMGDVIQFARYAPLIAQLGAEVVLEVPSALEKIMQSLQGVSQIITVGDALPSFDLHCPLMSLPAAVGTKLESLPANIPYLWVRPERHSQWLKRLDEDDRERGRSGRFRIAIIWSGNPEQANDYNRSVSLASLLPLLELPVDLHVAQRDIREPDLEVLAAHQQIRNWSQELSNFEETAALLASVNLVLSVCTSVAHLAGAMNRPVWILLPYAADYRWMCGSVDTPWYPSAKLFRQETPGSWDTTVARVCDEWRKL